MGSVDRRDRRQRAVGMVSVFMVVGGVVIMNIMLAVVSERTREIGVRKSVGARRQDILNQFLVESSMLAGFGGLIGVTIAWILAAARRRNVHARADGAAAERGRPGSDALGRRGPVLRNLSSTQGLSPRSDRRAARSETS